MVVSAWAKGAGKHLFDQSWKRGGGLRSIALAVDHACILGLRFQAPDLSFHREQPQRVVVTGPKSPGGCGYKLSHMASRRRRLGISQLGILVGALADSGASSTKIERCGHVLGAVSKKIG